MSFKYFEQIVAENRKPDKKNFFLYSLAMKQSG